MKLSIRTDHAGMIEFNFRAHELRTNPNAYKQLAALIEVMATTCCQQSWITAAEIQQMLDYRLNNDGEFGHKPVAFEIGFTHDLDGTPTIYLDSRDADGTALGQIPIL